MDRDFASNFDLNRHQCQWINWYSSTDLIIIIIRSGPSASRNNCLAFCSLRTEHNASKTFSMNSASSVSKGSLFRNCCFLKKRIAVNMVMMQLV